MQLYLKRSVKIIVISTGKSNAHEIPQVHSLLRVNVVTAGSRWIPAELYTPFIELLDFQHSAYWYFLAHFNRMFNTSDCINVIIKFAYALL